MPPPPLPAEGAGALWRWVGEGYRRPGGKGKSKKVFYKTIQRGGRDQLQVNDSAVFLSTGIDSESHEMVPYRTAHA